MQPHRFLFHALTGLLLLIAPACHAASPAADQGSVFATLTRDQLLDQPNKVFVHYVAQPVQYKRDDVWPVANGKPAYCLKLLTAPSHPETGGTLRLCPSPPESRDLGPDWQTINYKREINEMIAHGINGIVVDLFHPDAWEPGGELIEILHAAYEVDPRFKVLPMPDMTSLTRCTSAGPAMVVPMWQAATRERDPATGKPYALWNHPNIYRLPDAKGLPQLAPYDTECASPESWKAALAAMNAQGTPVAWGPVFASLGCSGRANGCIFSRYATEIPTLTLGGFNGVNTQADVVARNLVNVGGHEPGRATPGKGAPVLWAPSGPSGGRTVRLFGGMGPQAWQVHWGKVYESANSYGYRLQWENWIALKRDTQNIMINTWNDHGETTAIQQTQNWQGEKSRGFLDLTAYYANWFYTGQAPVIRRDAILYFYRKQTASAAQRATAGGTVTVHPVVVRPAVGGCQGKPASAQGACDYVEMIAFVTPDHARAGATLQIEMNGQRVTQPAHAGLNVMTAPLPATPSRPVFTLLANGQKLSLTGIASYGDNAIPGGTMQGLTCGSQGAPQPCFPDDVPDMTYYSDSTFP